MGVMEPVRNKCTALFKNNRLLRGVRWENCSGYSCHRGGHNRQLSFQGSRAAEEAWPVGCKSKSATGQMTNGSPVGAGR